MSEPIKTVLIRGAGNDLDVPVAAALLARGAKVALHSAGNPAHAAALAARFSAEDLPGQFLDLSAIDAIDSDPNAAFEALRTQGHVLDAVVHLYLPDASTSEAALRGYNDWLRPHLTAAIDWMRDSGSKGIIVNQFLMPTLFADHPLAPAMVEARNGVTALTKFGCLRGGREGVRVLSLMVGLLELPSLRALATERVNAAKTPLGRWITPEEVAGTIAFLTLDSGYMSGQSLVLDGGMTAGINGV